MPIRFELKEMRRWQREAEDGRWRETRTGTAGRNNKNWDKVVVKRKIKRSG